MKERTNFIKVTSAENSKKESVYLNTENIVMFQDDDINRGILYMDPMNDEEIPLALRTMETADEIFNKIQEATT